MIADQLAEGVAVEEDEANGDYTFDLAEFFRTKDNGYFEYEADVIKFLDTLTANEKYPFSTPELRDEIRHSFWLLNRVSSAKALERLLKKQEIFKNYTIVLAAGDGRSASDEGPFECTKTSVVTVVSIHTKVFVIRADHQAHITTALIQTYICAQCNICPGRRAAHELGSAFVGVVVKYSLVESPNAPIRLPAIHPVGAQVISVVVAAHLRGNNEGDGSDEEKCSHDAEQPVAMPWIHHWTPSLTARIR